MFAVYAAEQQYRHDTWARDREHAVLATIRERKTDVAQHPVTRTRAAVHVPVRAPRAAWARPIGLHTSEDCPTACAVA